jgi:hypothetical protein
MFSIVSLAVAIILPFLIIAFNVNEVLDKHRTLKRKLDYELIYVDSWWEKVWTVIWIVITLISSLLRPLWHMDISLFVSGLIRYIWGLAKNLAKVTLGSVREGISKVLGVPLKLRNIIFMKGMFQQTQSLKMQQKESSPHQAKRPRQMERKKIFRFP